ncbi:ankyrin repeat domain-containing protein [Bacillus manliponensis]|uniref:ankyrin repeat domain-containing protein n=1 Tax=Bacillus manliponensis TaxID=574376 RepID=UPI0035186796
MRKNLFLILLALVISMVACDKQSEVESVKVKEKKVEVEKEIKPKKKDSNWIDKQLLLSAKLGDTETVMKLVQDGAHINVQGEDGETPIMAATYHNHVETVKVLIEAGANIDIQDKNQDTPFLYASAEGFLEIVKLTIAAGADTSITNRYGGTALIPAAEKGHVEVVQELLTSTDIDVNHVNNVGWTALLEAVVLGNGDERHQQVVQLLLENGADVHIVDKEGKAPLVHATERGYTEMVDMLVEAGADETVETTGDM